MLPPPLVLTVNSLIVVPPWRSCASLLLCGGSAQVGVRLRLSGNYVGSCHRAGRYGRRRSSSEKVSQHCELLPVSRAAPAGMTVVTAWQLSHVIIGDVGQ